MAHPGDLHTCVLRSSVTSWPLLAQLLSEVLHSGVVLPEHISLPLCPHEVQLRAGMPQSSLLVGLVSQNPTNTRLPFSPWHPLPLVTSHPCTAFVPSPAWMPHTVPCGLADGAESVWASSACS